MTLCLVSVDGNFELNRCVIYPAL